MRSPHCRMMLVRSTSCDSFSRSLIRLGAGSLRSKPYEGLSGGRISFRVNVATADPRPPATGSVFLRALGPSALGSAEVLVLSVAVMASSLPGIRAACVQPIQPVKEEHPGSMSRAPHPRPSECGDARL